MSKQKSSGIRAGKRRDKNKPESDKDRDEETQGYPQLPEGDPVALIHFMLSFLAIKLQAEDFLTKAQKQKIHDAAQPGASAAHETRDEPEQSKQDKDNRDLPSTAPALPDDLKDAFTFSAQDEKGSLELEGRKLSFDAQSYVFDTPEENEDAGPVSPGQVFSVMALTRVTPDMANDGIEIFGPPEDMAMWLVAARHARLNVTNMDSVREHVSQELYNQAREKFTQYLETSELAGSEAVSALFDTASPGTLRQDLSGRFGEVLASLDDMPANDANKMQDQLGSINHTLAYIHAHKDQDDDIGELCNLTLEELDEADNAQGRKDVIVTFMKDNIGNDGDIDFNKFNRFIDKLEEGEVEKHPKAPGIAQIAQDYGYCSAGLARAGLITQVGVRMLEHSLSFAKNQNPDQNLDMKILPGLSSIDKDDAAPKNQDEEKDAVARIQELLSDMQERYKNEQGPSGRVNYPLQGLSALSGAVKQLKAEGYEEKAAELQNLGRVYLKEFENLAQNPPAQYADSWQALSIESAKHLGSIAQEFETEYDIPSPEQEEHTSASPKAKAPEPTG